MRKRGLVLNSNRPRRRRHRHRRLVQVQTREERSSSTLVGVSKLKRLTRVLLRFLKSKSDLSRRQFFFQSNQNEAVREAQLLEVFQPVHGHVHRTARKDLLQVRS